MSIPAQPIQPSSNKTRNIVLAVVAAFFALVLVGVVMAVNGFQQTRRAADPVADRFLTAVEKHDYPAAHRLLSPPAQKVTSTAKIADVVALLEKQRGQMTGHGESVNFFAGIDNGTSYAKATYRQEYRSGNAGNVVVVLVRNGGGHDGTGGWRVQSFNYQL